MSKRKPMPVFPDRLLSETKGMDAETFGAHFLLMIAAWNNDKCALENSDDVLATTVNLTKKQWLKIKTVVFVFPWVLDGGFWVNTDLAKERRRDERRPSILLATYNAVMDRDGQNCRYCGDTEGPFHLDHIVPWSKGGSHSVDNLTVACRACNLSKGDKSVDEWGGRL